MKRLFTILILCFVAFSASAQTYNVTFQVNMNLVGAAFTTPEVNGTFNGWCGGCNPLADGDGDGIWTATIALDAGTYEYKYAYDAWAGQEFLTEGSPCTVTAFGFTNRTLTVSGDVTLDVVCWGLCEDCGAPGLTQMDVPVTFDEVDVDYGLIGFGGAEASSIVEDPTDPSNTVAKVIKSATAELWAGTTITNGAGAGFANEIPFADGATTMSVRVWSPDSNIQVRLKVEDYADPTKSVETEATTTVAGDWETLLFDFSNEAPGTAAINYDYFYNKASIFFNFGVTGAIAGEKTYYFDDVQFGGGGGPAVYNVTFNVNMNEVVAGFTTPEVNGTFNGWCGGCNPLSDPEGDGIWSTTIAITEGTHEFKYAYDAWAGSETLTEGDPCTITAFGFTNRSLNVTGDTNLDVVCWGSCSDCAGVDTTYAVTFHVNMNEVADPYTLPEVNGTFNGWCGGCNPLSDDDGDGIWSATLFMPAGDYQYKFAYDAWAGSENLIPGADCTITDGGFTNRALTVTGDVELDVVCWGSCVNCGLDSLFNVTFIVDMNEVLEPFTTPEVNGTFNGWCGGCAPMADPDGDNVWELTIPLAAGSYEYKFAYDAWAGQETLTEGDPCTITAFGFTNRSLVVTGDAVLDEVCWASCSACDGVIDTSFDIVFHVNMNDVTEPFTTPEVNGTFNGWCGGCAPMSDPDGDNIWDLTISLTAGTYEYKFAYDAWAGSETLTEGAPCTITTGGFTNRALTVTGDADLGVVCWGACADCGVGIHDLPIADHIVIAPNPAKDVITISLHNNGSEALDFYITDIVGNVVDVYQNITDTQITIPTDHYDAGMYFVRISDGSESITRNFVIQR